MAQPRSQRLTDSTHSQGGALRAAVWALAAAFSLVVAPSLIGCRSVDNAQVDLLERELRQQEDYIYELEDYLMEYSEKLRQARMACQASSVKASEPAKKKSALVEPELVEDPPRPRRPAPRSGQSTYRSPPVESPENLPDGGPTEPAAQGAEPAVDPAPESETPDPAQLEPPDLEIGDPGASLQWQQTAPVAAAPAFAEPANRGAQSEAATTEAAASEAAAPASVPPGDEAPPFMPDPIGYQLETEDAESLAADEVAPFEAPAPEEFAAQQAAPAVEDVELALPPLAEGPEAPPVDDAARAIAARLEVRQAFTQPSPDDPGRLGSLLVVVEALNAMDEPVDAVGTISLMVMARDETGAQRRVDRWDFTAEETRAAWQSSRLGDGMHLHLPLGATELPAGPLELWARLVGDDGAKLLTQLPFDPAELVAFDDAMAVPETAVAATAAEAVGDEIVETEGEAAPVTATSLPVPTPQPTWRAATRSVAVPAGGDDAAGWTSRTGGGALQEGVVADAAKREAAQPAKTATSASTWTRRTK